MPGSTLFPIPDDDAQPLRLVVLAGHGAGSARRGRDALAAQFGQSHRCLVPLAGRPLIAHVLQAAAQHPRITSLAICIEKEAFDPVWDVLTRLPGRGSVKLVDAQSDIAQSVRAAAEGWDGPLLVTTADHALLSVESIDAMIAVLDDAHVAFALTPRAAVEAAHPGAGRDAILLRDGEFVACDLYGMASNRYVDAVAIFGGARRDASRIVRAIGYVGLLMVWLRMETLAGAVTRASRRLGMRVSAVMLDDGSQAIDVDDDRTYAIVRELLNAGLQVSAAT